MPKHDTHEDTTLLEKPEVAPEALPPPVINTEYDTPPKEWVPGTTYDPETPPEDLTNVEYIQWAYDNLMPFWAIKANLKYRTPATISGLEPSTAAIGDPSFTLYVTGTNFHAESVIVFAGQDENTTLNEDGRLQTGVNMGFWHGADTVPVCVRNGLGGVVSEPVDFTFTAAAASQERAGEGGARKAFEDYPPEPEHDEDEDDKNGKKARKRK